MKKPGRPKLISDETLTELYRLWDTNEYGYQRIAKMLGIKYKANVVYWIKKRNKEQVN